MTTTMLTEQEVRADERARALRDVADMIAALPCPPVHDLDVLLGLARDMIAAMVRDMAPSASAGDDQGRERAPRRCSR